MRHSRMEAVGIPFRQRRTAVIDAEIHLVNDLLVVGLMVYALWLAHQYKQYWLFIAVMVNFALSGLEGALAIIFDSPTIWEGFYESIWVAVGLIAFAILRDAWKHRKTTKENR